MNTPALTNIGRESRYIIGHKKLRCTTPSRFLKKLSESMTICIIKFPKCSEVLKYVKFHVDSPNCDRNHPAGGSRCLSYSPSTSHTWRGLQTPFVLLFAAQCHSNQQTEFQPTYEHHPVYDSLRRRIHYIDSLSRQVKSNSNRTETITNQQQICTLCMRLQPANTCIKSNRTSQTWMRPARMKIISLDSHI